MSSPLHKSRLGRGLASLIGEPAQPQARLPSDGEHKIVAIELVKAGALNPRRDFRDDELEELASSIRHKGLVQPIIVRPEVGGPGYEIVAGERRWRAAQKAGMHTVPIIVRDLSDQQTLEYAIIENVQRSDLNAIEEALGYRDLIERFGYTQESVADAIGKSRSHLANTLRLLKLPPSVQTMVQEGRLTAGHVRPLVGRDDAELLAQQILDRQLNVREVEALVQLPDAGQGRIETRRVREKDADTRAFEKELSDALGLKVEIKRGSGESGALTVRFGNFDQLDYIRLRLTGMAG
ncbi:MAG: ParB/RepB/Spo0J family partition protein [Hyphomicrobiaceae bacterium]|nr:ParB/RepB/Spo0J family partition protein [Hyphomicrobiaceae bacterium]